MAKSICLRDDKDGEVEDPEKSFEQGEVPIEVERIVCQASVSVFSQDIPAQTIFLNLIPF